MFGFLNPGAVLILWGEHYLENRPLVDHLGPSNFGAPQRGRAVRQGIPVHLPTPWSPLHGGSPTSLADQWSQMDLRVEQRFKPTIQTKRTQKKHSHDWKQSHDYMIGLIEGNTCSLAITGNRPKGPWLVGTGFTGSDPVPRLAPNFAAACTWSEAHLGSLLEALVQLQDGGKLLQVIQLI